MRDRRSYVVGARAPELIAPGVGAKAEAAPAAEGRLFVTLHADGSEVIASFEFLTRFFNRQPEAARRALRLIGESAATFVPDFDLTSAIVAGEIRVSLKPGERFRRLVAACRTCDLDPRAGEET